MGSPTPLLKPKLHHFFDQAGENSHRKNLTIPLFYFIISVVVFVLKYYMGFKKPMCPFYLSKFIGPISYFYLGLSPFLFLFWTKIQPNNFLLTFLFRVYL